MLPVDARPESEVKMTESPEGKRGRIFPQLDLSGTATLSANTNQPVLVVQSPKTPTLSRKLKAVSLDSDTPKQTVTLEVSRDVFSMPNTPKRQVKPKYLSEFDDGQQKLALTPGIATNLTGQVFGSNTSISGSQTLKTLPEVMMLQDFSYNPAEPIRMKAKGLLERRGSNASLTIDLGSNSSISESKSVAVAIPSRLNTAKSVSNLNLSTFGGDLCSCSRQSNDRKKEHADRRKLQTFVEKCASCVIYESEPSKTNGCQSKCSTFAKNKKCPCPCNYKCRRKSLSNENLYVPPCNHCQEQGEKECVSNAKGHRRACYPRQADLEASQLLSEDFKLHLQNIQYLQTAGSVLSIADLKSSLEASRVPKLHQEFWEVPLNLQEKCIVSGSQNRNRYKGVLPNEHSRVQLPGAQTYIHANYIKGPEYTETAYIATQGPMAHTCEDFWDMIWTSKSNCIVMLTGLVEKGHNKCELYFPLGKKNTSEDKSYFLVKTTTVRDKFTFDTKNTVQYDEEIVKFEEHDVVRYGKFEIRYVKEQTLGECVVRELELCLPKRPEGRRSRTVHHYWFPGWQDHKMANPEQVLQMALHVIDLMDKTHCEQQHDNNFLTHAKEEGTPKLSDDGSGTAVAQSRRYAENKRFNSRWQVVGKLSESGQQKATESHASTESNRTQPSHKLGHKLYSKVVSNVTASSKYTESEGNNASPETCGTIPDVRRNGERNSAGGGGNGGPVVVHCSAGIGRTGCFLAILNGIRQLRSNCKVDVLAILCSLRLNRGGMVQTAEQYELIHRVLALYVDAL